MRRLLALLSAAVLTAVACGTTPIVEPAMDTTVPGEVVAGEESVPEPTIAGASTGAALRVDGNRLVDAAGAEVRLRGVNYAGSEYACVQGWGIFEGPTDRAQVERFRAWGVDAVRVVLNEHCWLGRNGIDPAFSGEAYRTAVLDWIDLLRAEGLWVVVSLIWSDTGATPATDQAVMPNTDHSLDFWDSLARELVDRDGLLLDLYGEPHDVDWDCWQSGCVTEDGYPAAGLQEVLDVVRDAGSTHPVVVGGLEYANDLSGWLGYPVVDSLDPPQVVAGWHSYDFNNCVDVECWEETVGRVAEEVPVVVAEFGGSTCDGTYVVPLLEWMDERRLSYLAWTWNPWGACEEGPDLVTDWEGTPTGYGAAVRTHYLGRAAEEAGS